jgi:hypothetical protein
VGVAIVGVAFVVRVCLAVPGRFMIAGFRSSCFTLILRTFVSSINELEKRFGKELEALIRKLVLWKMSIYR